MKPIIFSTENVKALLDGRKTMARLAIKPQPVLIGMTGWPTPILHIPKKGPLFPGSSDHTSVDVRWRFAPYRPGDVLWVRETWRVGAWDDEGSICVDYKADGFARREWLKISDCDLYEELWQQSSDDAREANATIDEDGNYTWLPGQSPTRWRSPVTMPREAARLFLRVKDVRVERVQDISEEDAKAEGVTAINNSECGYRGAFRELWNTLNAKRGFDWYTNSWVWVIEFEKCEPE